MVQQEVLHGYYVVFEIPNVNVFQFIQRMKDDFLWDRGFRPAFTEEKYVRYDEKRIIILTPTCKFTVEIEPQPQAAADEQLENTRLLIKDLGRIIVPDGQYEIHEDLKHILVFYQSLDLKTLLPTWYLSAVDISSIKLQEFKTFVEDLEQDKIRQTEVTLKTKEGKVLEIKITSPDLTLAKKLIQSISGSNPEG
ncbi:MAG: hypothetical protein QW279_13610 [Candidatus Jordarchaeaceae archaeon]